VDYPIVLLTMSDGRFDAVVVTALIAKYQVPLPRPSIL